MKNSLKYFLPLAQLGLLLVVAGCANYDAEPIKKKIVVPTKAKTEKVELSCKALNTSECKHYFDRDILAAGYQPILLSIENFSKNSYVLTPANLNVRPVPADVVAEKVHTNTAGRVVGWAVGGLIVPFLWIAAVCDGIWSAQANEKLDKDFEAKELNEQVIYPNTGYDAFIFVERKEMPTRLDVTLINQNDHTDQKIVSCTIEK